MSVNQLEKRISDLSARRVQWAAAGDSGRVMADLEAMSESELDQFITNLFLVEAGSLWESTDYSCSYAEILQQLVNEDSLPEVWPQQLVEIFERHGVQVPTL